MLAKPLIPSIFKRDILPLAIWFISLLALTAIFDGLGHFFAPKWPGLWGLDYVAGPIGCLMILLSFVYSLRKRKLITWSSPKRLLILHEYLTWGGSLLLLIHAGIHGNGLLAWLAIGALLIAVISGLVGKFLLARASKTLKLKQETLAGLDQKEAAQKLFFDLLMVKAMKQWRSIHRPITSVFALLALAHVIGVTLFGKL